MNQPGGSRVDRCPKGRRHFFLVRMQRKFVIGKSQKFAPGLFADGDVMGRMELP